MGFGHRCQDLRSRRNTIRLLVFEDPGRRRRGHWCWWHVSWPKDLSERRWYAWQIQVLGGDEGHGMESEDQGDWGMVVCGVGVSKSGVGGNWARALGRVGGRWLCKPLLDVGLDSIPIDLVYIYTWL